jgi:hypothetical protein
MHFALVLALLPLEELAAEVSVFDEPAVADPVLDDAAPEPLPSCVFVLLDDMSAMEDDCAGWLI